MRLQPPTSPSALSGADPWTTGAAASQLISVEPNQLRLMQAHAWAKTGREGEELAQRGERDNDDQRMHFE